VQKGLLILQTRPSERYIRRSDFIRDDEGVVLQNDPRHNI